MSDLSNRARVIATKSGQITGSSDESKYRLAMDLIFAISSLYRGDKTALATAFFNLAALSSLYGIDVVDGVQMAIEQREVTGKKAVPGTLAPVPNAKTNDGTLRDPAGERQDWE